MRRLRAGFGVPLVVVLGVILVLMSLGLSLGVRSQGVTRAVRRAVFRDEAEAFAQAAVQEALYRLRVGANRPDDPAFALFRVEEVPAAAATLRVRGDALLHTRAMLARDSRYALVGDQVEVEVLRRGAATLEPEERVGYEAPGVVQLRATVVGPMGITGTKVVDFAFRAVLTGAPRPFDTATFFVADPRHLLLREAYLGEPNQAIQSSVTQVEGLRQSLIDMAAAFAELEDAADDADDDGSAQLARDLKDSYLAAVEPGTWPARRWTVRPEASSESLENEDEIHLFYPALMVYSLAEDLELETLDLPTRFEALVPEIVAAEGPLRELNQAIDAMLPIEDEGQIPVLAERCRAYLQLVLEHVARHEQMLTAYKDFQAALIEVGGDARDVLLARYRRFLLRDQVWKAPYVFSPATHPDPVAAATAFLAEGPEGMVLVRGGPGDQLDVSLQGYEGRLVLACDVPVRLSKVTVADPSRDAVTVLAYQGLEVSDTVQAGLYLLGGGYRSAGGSFEGALHLNTIPESGALELILKGNLTRQPALASAALPGPGQPLAEPDPEKVHVVVGAEPLRREVEL